MNELTDEQWARLAPTLRAAINAVLGDASPPVSQPALLARLDIQGSTSGEWVKGYSTNRNLINFAGTAPNREFLRAGRTIKTSAGEERQITKVDSAYGRLLVGYSGSLLKPVDGLVEIYEDPSAVKPDAPEVEVETPAPANPTPTAKLPLIGLNFAGLGNNPSVDANFTAEAPTHYRTVWPVYKKTAQPDYVGVYSGHLKGEPWLARIPFAGERLVILDGKGSFTLRESYIAEIRGVVRRVAENGGTCLLDMHNYCRWYIPAAAVDSKRDTGTFNGKAHLWSAIGSSECPVSYELLARIWAAIAREFKDEPGIFGWGLMNEPHNRSKDLPGFNVENAWLTNLPLLIKAVREVDMAHWITVAGLSYSSAKQWPKVSDSLRFLVDPADKLIFEAHQYADKGGGGGGAWERDANGNVIETSIDAQARANDWDPFLGWLQKYGLRGLAGEFGGPGGTPSLDLYFKLLWDKLEAAGVPGCQWLAGPGDSDGDGNGMDRNDGTLKANARELIARIGRYTSKYGFPRP